MIAMPAWSIAVTGLATGFLLGYFVRRARLCSFGAIEDALIGHDWRRIKVFALALAIAIGGTQLLIGAGLLDPTQSTYVPPRVALVSTIIGGVIFGFGMALVGTCAFGSLVRLGGGDLRSLVTMIVFGMIAYATLRGVLSGLRIDVLEQLATPMPGDTPSGLAHLLDYATGGRIAPYVAALLATGLALLALLDTRLREAPRLMTAGVMLGAAVVFGWWVTGVAADDFEVTARVQSLTFVAPIARALVAVLASLQEWLDFGVMTVPGVMLGAFAYARQKREFRWEAFDDHHEMRRHMVGGVMMGFGGVLAGGCTIGQGLTAGSLLAITWPVAVGGMIVGARLGIAYLVEGSVTDLIRHWLTRGVATGSEKRKPAE